MHDKISLTTAFCSR